MDRLWYLLPVLACPLTMGLLMWVMMRPRNAGSGADGQSRAGAPPAPLTADERAELDRLRGATGVHREYIERLEHPQRT